MNVLQAAAVQQAQFTANLAEMGYKTVTTFYADLTIAEEMGGADGVRDTYASVCKEWRGNAEYYTEFVLALNHKIWQHYKTNEPLARVYDELWREADGWAVENLKGDDLAHYYDVTD